MTECYEIVKQPRGGAKIGRLFFDKEKACDWAVSDYNDDTIFLLAKLDPDIAKRIGLCPDEDGSKSLEFRSRLLSDGKFARANVAFYQLLKREIE